MIKLLSLALLVIPGLHALQKHEARDIAQQVIQQAVQELFDGITENNLDKIRLALDLGASPNEDVTWQAQLPSTNTITTFHKTPLTLAIQSKDAFNIATLLLKYDANVNKQDGQGNLPLHLAIFLNRPELVDLFIANNADINLKDRNYQNPLHIAIEVGNKQIIEKLLSHGANPNAFMAPHLKTPLQEAIFRKKTEIVKLFLTYGANTIGAYHYALQYCTPEIAELIRKHEETLKEQK
ncbi:MAG: ankyrin repeat domain-containing protein [Candidatus Dependentiae bacterium]